MKPSENTPACSSAVASNAGLDADDIDLVDLIKKIEAAKERIFLVEQCLYKKNSVLHERAFNARYEIGFIEDWALRKSGIRGG